MAASKSVASPEAATAAVLVLLALVMLIRPPTALAVRHLPVTRSHHRSLINLLRPPSPPHIAVDNYDFSVLRKVPRGPGHSPNDTSPPPPPLSAATTAKISLEPATEQAARHLPVTTSHLRLLPPDSRPVISHPPPPPTSAATHDEFSVLRKAHSAPGHSPNDPSPPPLSLLATEEAAHHLPVTTSHIHLLPPSGHGRPVISHPLPPPTIAAANDEFSVLKKVPRGPGHSPNAPSPPPPLLLVTEQEEAAASEHPSSWCFQLSPPPQQLLGTEQEAAAASENPASWCYPPIHEGAIDAAEPAAAGKQE